MKYEKEFRNSKTKNTFINKLLNKYSISKSTAVRRYYDLRKSLNTTKEIIKSRPPIVIPKVYSFLSNPLIIAEKPSMFKMLLVDDIKRLSKNDIIDEFKIQGFSTGEIKWLKENKLI